MCVSVCGFVVTLSGCGNVLPKKKTAKKEACASRVASGAVSKPAYAGALGQTYVRQLMLVAPPTLHPFGLVAVAVLADTMFELVRCSRCFFT